MADAKPVFISYARNTSRDAAMALHRELGAERCFLDTTDIDLLEEFPRRLSEALLAARVVVCLIDATYFRRAYCVREWMLALLPWREALSHRDSDGDPIDLSAALQHVVVALPETALGREDLLRLPDPLRAQNLPAAARSQDLARAVRARLGASEFSLRELLDARRVPAAHRDLITSPLQIPFAPQKLTIPVNRDNLPPTLHDRFIGRANEIWRVHDLLNTQRSGGDEAAQPTGALVSGGGFGKTRLAVEYLHRFAPSAYPGGAFWIDASQPDAMDRQFRVLVALKVPVGPQASGKEIRELLTQMLASLEQRVLYVVDNLPEAAAGHAPLPIGHFCPAIGAVTCLVTSRVQQHFGSAIGILDLDILPPAEACTLLMRGVDPDALSLPEQDALAAWCGHLPLALEVINGGLAGGALLPREAVAFTREGEVAERLTAEVDALRGEVPEESLRSITQAFDVSWQRLAPDARELAEQVAWLAPAPIPVELLDELAPRAARTVLVTRSFLTPARETPDTFSMHRVLASFLRSKAPGAEVVARGKLFTILAGDEEQVQHDADLRRRLELLVPHFAWHVRRAERVGGSVTWLTRSVLPTMNALARTSADSAAGRLTLGVVQRLLRDADRTVDADGWATLQVWLGNVLRHLGEREEGTERLSEAVAAHRAALEVYTRERVPLDWAKTQNNLGSVLQRLGEREEGTERLSEAVTAYRAALEVYTRERVPLDWAMTQNNLGSVLSSLGGREEGTERLSEAVTAIRAALEVYTRERVPLDWAMTQNNLGDVLQRLGEREEGTERLSEAVTAIRAALEVYTREGVPLDWAMTQNNLGIVLSSLGEREEGTERLSEAVTAFRAALEVYTRERVPFEWAGTQNNLGNVLHRLGEREEGTERLSEAVAAFRAALEVYTRERVPLDWAGTQNNLGSVLSSLGEREEGTERLSEAVTAIRAALEVRTRERVPLEWAGTQNNLGNVLHRLGEREEGTERLSEAVAAHRAALEVYTRERVPLEWAGTQNNLGNVLQRLGEREEGTERLSEAVAAYRAALEVYTRERVPLDWAMTQNNLGIVLSSLGEREEGTERLSEAVAAYRAALEVYTRERVPLDWAGTQNNLGSVLSSLGEREEGTERLSEAVAAFRAALEVYTRERVPLDWAGTQNNLGLVFEALARREDSARRLTDALAAYREASTILARVPALAAQSRQSLARVRRLLAKRREASAE